MVGRWFLQGRERERRDLAIKSSPSYNYTIRSLFPLWRRRKRIYWWMKMWDKMAFPVRRVWDYVAMRLGIRKTGLLRLRREVRSCEYRDVHVMWEMLNRNEAEHVRSPVKTKKRFCWKFFQWTRCTPYLYRSCP